MCSRSKPYIVLSACIAIGLGTARCTLAPAESSGEQGSLRVLVTDEPYPLDLIEEANITITRVEVRLTEELPICTEDTDCADNVFCNGTETCLERECVNGEFPCAAGEFCDEELAACMSPCTDDTQCNDLFFCNGAETCDLGTGECQEGVNPCTPDQVCDESADICTTDESDQDDDDDESTWITIFEGNKSFNLLDLQNGQTDLLAETTITAGTYSQMRLVVTQGEVKLEDVEEPFLLDVPSGEQTGIKLHFTFDVTADEETVLLLDVDLTRAFRPIPAGHIDDPTTIRTFHFTPSVAMKLINLLEAGTITGTVVDESSSALEDVIVTAYDENGEEAASGGTDSSGGFTLIGLPTGIYRLELSLNGFEDAAVPDVSVTAEETTDVGAVVMIAVIP
ncbi:MAG: DUF4382 domain-containing protein [Phycisphaerales bacterium]|nr:MAG: DUF4382 domain-containing protein [Phycisphaerales bacterium]